MLSKNEKTEEKMGWSRVEADREEEEGDEGEEELLLCGCSAAYRKVGMMGTGEQEKGDDNGNVVMVLIQYMRLV